MTTTLTKLTLVTLAALALSTSFASAGGGNNGIIQMPQINIPQINVNNGPVIDKDPPSFGPAKPIKILDDGVGSGGPGPHTTPVTDHNQPQGFPDVGCKVQAPGASTDDIWIINIGDVTLPMGSRIRYRVPSTGDHGAFELPRDLAVGQKLKVSDLLSDAASGAPCTVRLVV
jgi:hypothetical protein